MILVEAFNRFREYVMNETLAVSARWLDTAAEGSVTIESGETSWEADIVRVAE
jgi:beta-lactamase superfamily II metal-dependent hydrolase